MALEKLKDMGRRVPVWTLMIVLLSLLLYRLPRVSSLLIYDRAAVRNGEVWRIITGHLIHFDLFHLTYDLSTFGIAGILIERRSRGSFLLLCALMASFIGASLPILRPEMQFYGGLSGLATGAVVYLALSGFHGAKSFRWAYAAVLAIVSIKVLLEVCKGQSLLFYPAPPTFELIPSSHVIGSLVAVSLFYAQRIGGGRRREGNCKQEPRLSAALRQLHEDQRSAVRP